MLCHKMISIKVDRIFSGKVLQCINRAAYNVQGTSPTRSNTDKGIVNVHVGDPHCINNYCCFTIRVPFKNTLKRNESQHILRYDHDRPIKDEKTNYAYTYKLQLSLLLAVQYSNLCRTISARAKSGMLTGS